MFSNRKELHPFNNVHNFNDSFRMNNLLGKNEATNDDKKNPFSVRRILSSGPNETPSPTSGNKMSPFTYDTQLRDLFSTPLSYSAKGYDSPSIQSIVAMPSPESLLYYGFNRVATTACAYGQFNNEASVHFPGSPTLYPNLPFFTPNLSAISDVSVQMNNGCLTKLNEGVVNGGNKRGGKPRSWTRCVFTDSQRKGLEKKFQIQKYIAKPDRKLLAEELRLEDAQVKVWFQNRRMKWRHSKEYKEELSKSDHNSTVSTIVKSDAFNVKMDTSKDMKFDKMCTN